MPYTKRTYRKRTPKKATKLVTMAEAKRLVRSELKREDKKDHPLQWVDVKFTGNSISTTPFLFSVESAITNQIVINSSYQQWPVRYDSTNSEDYRQCNVFVTGVNYQFRFKQNDAAGTDLATNVVRSIAYSLNDTYQENSQPILGGGDIDQPPRTEDVSSMYYDRLFTLKAQLGDADNESTPDQKIQKGSKKLYHKFVMEERGDSVAVEEGGDIRFEFQSDDNDVISDIEMFGFIRIYYRVMA